MLPYGKPDRYGARSGYRRLKANMQTRRARLFAVSGGLLAFLMVGGLGCSRSKSADSSTTAPRIDSVEPAFGARAGGTRVAIRGANLGKTKTVLFGAFGASKVEVKSDELLEVETAAQAPGKVDVTVLSDVGTGVAALAFQFSENVSPQIGPITGGTAVTVLGRGFDSSTTVLFGKNAAQQVNVLHNTVLIAVTPPGAAATAVNVEVRGTGILGNNALVYTNAFEYTTAVAGDGGPRVVSAISTSNTTVRVSFSEALDNNANDSSNFSIIQPNVNSESAVLPVKAAALSPDRMSVLLTTAPQNEVTYEVIVTNLKDLAGNMLAAPELLVDPTRAQFAGSPPTAGGADSDGDGLPDNVEQTGYAVTIKLANGEVESRTVTSDTSLADTDGDRLTDAEEKGIGSDPRAKDTDGDQIDDYTEWNEWFSDPFNQDSDNDGFADNLEVGFFGTSSITPDTDGDQMTDGEEILRRNRNPLIADLPVPQVTVDAVRLDLKVTSSYTDEEGVTKGVQDTTSTSLVQSRSTTTGLSTTESIQTENESSQKLGVEVSYGTKDGFGVSAKTEFGFTQKTARGFSSTASRESAVASQQEYQRSISQALEESARRAVTRNIDEAIMQATVNLANQSDIAFTITNLELSVLQQDRRNGTRFRPLATLRANGGAGASYNLGPFDPERGPIIFQNVEIFPNLVDELMREPTGLVFKIVNYDVLDEFGRNFVFSSQEVNDRTAGITIDFGDGVVERYRVATHNKFDSTGKPMGITMQRAMEIAGITASAAPDEPFPPAEPLPDAIRKTYGTLVDTTGSERLTRVRGIQNDLDGTPEKRFWALVTNNMEVQADSDFSTIQVSAGDDYTLLYTRDVDEDGLFEREEYLYGSSDSSSDSDADTLNDFFEVRTGWMVSSSPGTPYRVFSAPNRDDSDMDGLRDDRELVEKTDPNRSDTDEDGMLDAQELNGTFDLVLFDGDQDDSNDKIITLSPYSDAAIIDGGNGVNNTTAQGDDVQVVAAGAAVAAGNIVIAAGPNGVIDTTPGGDDRASAADNVVSGPDNIANTTKVGDDIQVVAVGQAAPAGTVIIRAGLNGRIDSIPNGDDYTRVAHRSLYTTSPLNQDSDFDGIPDGRELLIGTNPNARDAGKVIDSDGDGLFDLEEDTGWPVTVVATTGTTTVQKISNKFRADTDLDGVPDVLEWAVKSDPTKQDTDGDGLFDEDELDPDDTDRYYAQAELVEGFRRCEAATSCNYNNPRPNLADRFRTHVAKVDSDGDTLGDFTELTTTWPVSVFGSTTPYAISSKAFSSDFDLDGLNDSQEKTGGTDPNKADTDEDGLVDGLESGRGRNPLRIDKRVRLVLNLSTVQVNGDCEPDIDGSGEFNGQVFFDTPAANDADVQAYDLSNCAGNQGSACCTSGCSGLDRSFIMHEGDTFRIYSSNVIEDDGSCGPACEDEVLGSFAESYSFNSLSITSRELTESNTCKLTFNWQLVAD